MSVWLYAEQATTHAQQLATRKRYLNFSVPNRQLCIPQQPRSSRKVLEHCACNMAQKSMIPCLYRPVGVKTTYPWQATAVARLCWLQSVAARLGARSHRFPLT